MEQIHLPFLEELVWNKETLYNINVKETNLIESNSPVPNGITEVTVPKISEVVEVEKQVHLEIFKGQVSYRFPGGRKKELNRENKNWCPCKRHHLN